MKLRALLIAVVASAGCITFLTGCENDAPEMNISVTYNHISDFSGLVDAVNNQTAILKVAFDENGNLIMTALDRNGREISNALTDGFSAATAAISEKMEALILAVDSNTVALVNMTDDLNERMEDLRKTAVTVGASLVYALNKNGELIVLAIKENGEVIAAELVNQTEQLRLLNSNLLAVGSWLVASIDRNTVAIVTMDGNTKTAIRNLTSEVEAQGGHIRTAINDQGQAVVAAFDRNGSLITAEIAGVATQVAVVAGAIGTLDADLKVLMTAATTAITKFDADNQQALAGVEDAVKNIGANIVVAVDGSLTDVTNAINAQKGALVAAINDNGDLINVAIGEVKQELVTMNAKIVALDDNLQAVITAQTTAITDFDADMKAKLDALTSEVNTQGGNLSAAIGTLDGNVSGAIGAQQVAIVGAINTQGGSLGTAIAGVQTAIGEVKTVLTNYPTDFNTAMNQLVVAVNNNTQAIATLDTNNANKLQALVSAVSDSSGSLVTAIVNQKTAIVSAIASNGAVLGSVVVELQDIEEAIKDLGSGVFQIGSDYYLTKEFYEEVSQSPTLSESLANSLFGSTTPADISITISHSETSPSGHAQSNSTPTIISPYKKGIGNASPVTDELVKIKLVWAFADVKFPMNCSGHKYIYGSVTDANGNTITQSFESPTSPNPFTIENVRIWDDTNQENVTSLSTYANII